MRPWYKSGATGWLLLAGLVVGWDYLVGVRYGGETLTGAFRRTVRVALPEGQIRKHPYLLLAAPVGAAWGVTTLHLFGILPSRYDPYHWTGFYMKKFTETR